MDEITSVDGARSVAHAWDYREWCRRQALDPDSLDAILGYEDLFDETDEDQQTLDFTL